MDDTRVPPADSFVAKIKKLMADLREFKQFQRSGQDSVRMYRIFSDLAADKTLTSVGLTNKKFRLTFTPAEAQFATSIVYKMEYTYIESPDGAVQIAVERERITDETKQSWVFIVSGSDFFPSSLVTLKFYFWASGNGTFTTTDL